MLLKCIECGNEISIDATSCPKCGSKKPFKGIVLGEDAYKELPWAQRVNFKNLGGSITYPKWAKIVGSVLLTIIAIVIIIGIFGPDTPEEIEKKKQEAFEEKQAEAERKQEGINLRAVVSCRTEIENVLNDPDSFEAEASSILKLPDGTYKVTQNMRAKNAFGGYVSGQFQCHLKPNREWFDLIKINQTR